MAPAVHEVKKVPSSVSLPPDLDLKVRNVAVATGVQRCHVVEECVARTIDSLPSLPTIGGKRNRSFAGTP